MNECQAGRSGLDAMRVRASRAVRGIMEWFPERQIYIRSEGRVQFYTFGRNLQITAAGLTSISLMWVAFSTVTVVFKDRIIAAEDHRFQNVQEAFETRSAALQVAYDELVAKAAGAQANADGRVSMLGHRQQGLERQSTPVRGAPSPRHAVGGVKTATGTLDRSRTMLVKALRWLGLGHQKPRLPLHHPSLDRLAADTATLSIMARQSDAMMATMESGALQRVAGEKALIAGTGINPDAFLRQVETVEGVGGPEVPLDSVPLDGVGDRDFSQAYFRAEADLAQFQDLRRAEMRLPTATPLRATIERTSGFGPRLDPFSGRYAFHAGVDFAAPAGTPVLATASGRVTFAGADGSYGNMVEIDHGLGLKTRYAHLLSVAVAQGQDLAKGAIVGRLGSTGRSTGPHVHYEVWYDDKVRNPDGFLRVGRLTGR